jgi:hypothetical protein
VVARNPTLARFPEPPPGLATVIHFWKLATVDRKVLIPAARKVVSFTHGAFLYSRLLLALSGASGNDPARLLDPPTARNTADDQAGQTPTKSIDEFNLPG